jgi:hypothetical protein
MPNRKLRFGIDTSEIIPFNAEEIAQEALDFLAHIDF